jgi:hypothetical protein
LKDDERQKESEEWAFGGEFEKGFHD